MNQKKRIGFFGGTFSPIHSAHVHLAMTAKEQLHLDEVWFVVSPHNPFKDAFDLLNENHRFHMVECALEGLPGLIASRVEFELSRPSYTANTLTGLHHQYPDVEWVLLLGEDNVAGFPAWEKSDWILREFVVAAYPRSGSPEHPTALPIHWLEGPPLDISSTSIREALHRGQETDNRLHPKVKDYIDKHHLYPSK